METQYLVLLVLYFLTIIGLWKLFEKAGEKSWKAFVPFYNFYIWLKLIQKPWWWLFLLVVPGINFLMILIMSLLLAKSFGRKQTLELVLATFAGVLYLPYIGFQSAVTYTGPPVPSTEKSMLKEWGDAILFAVIAATIIRTFFFEAFTIPTSSLEKSLMVGDYLFVSKLSYGPKIPNTPLSFPFAHHTLPWTKYTKSYLEWIKLPYLRLPGFGSVKNNDIFVFNYPDGDTVALDYQNQSYYQICRDNGYASLYNNPNAEIEIATEEGKIKRPIGKVVARPVDKRENYVKRCIAIAGDKLEIKDAEVYINDKHVETPEHAQYHYFVKTKGFVFGEINYATRKFEPNLRLFDKFDIYVDEAYIKDIAGDTVEYLLNMPLSTVEKVKSMSNIISITKEITPKGEYQDRIFPHNDLYKWNNDNFGPFLIPKENSTVELNKTNIVLYNQIIVNYEGNSLEVKDDKIFINGKETTSYTFKLNYYFMMGDNRQNSADSRYWGVVPEDHIVGKPVFVWMSIKDPQKNPLSGNVGIVKSFTQNSQKGKFRWNRFFTFIGDNGLSRSYLSVFLIIVGAIISISYFLRKRRERISKS